MTGGKTIEERVKEYAEIKKKVAELYATFGSVPCAALGDQRVYFTSEGFNHLVYKAPKKPRDERVQILRFDMLEKAKFILESSTTYQEYDEIIVNKKVNRRGKWIYKNVVVRCWGFIAIVSKFRIKVIVKQEGNGKLEFQSVIPAWFVRQYRDIRLIQTSTGRGLMDEDDGEVLKNATQG